MKLTTTVSLPGSRDTVFAALTDATVLQRCIEGCEKMVQTAEDHYDAHLKLGLAGLKGTYVGKVQIKDKNVPEAFTLGLEGKGGPGFVKGTARIQLAAKGQQTELRCEADVQVGGMIAAVGSRLIEATARKLVDDFFRKFADQLQQR